MNTQVTTREIATANGVSLRTAQRWAKTGKLDAVKINGRWTITLAVADDYKPAQITAAFELLEQDGITPTSRPGTWVAISSDGETYYPVTTNACGCKAGLRDIRCYHRLAAQVLDAGRRAA